MTRIGLLFLGLIAVLASAANANAQERPLNNSANGNGNGDATTTTTTTTTDSPSSSDVALHDEQAGMETAHEHTPGATQHARDATDPFEDPHESYFFLGAFYRHFIAPTYALNFFVDGGKIIDEPGGGIQFTYRKDGLSISGQVWGMSAAFQGIFREAGKTPNETESWDSNWGVVWAAASFMWSTAFNDMFAIEYGFDIGAGVMFNNATRTEAYNTSPAGAGESPIIQNHWLPCQGPGMGQSGHPGDLSTCQGPSVPDGTPGEQYHAQIHNWSNGGNVPIVVPWLGVPHIALRFKPIHQLEIRVDVGAYAVILAYYMGASLAYGF